MRPRCPRSRTVVTYRRVALQPIPKPSSPSNLPPASPDPVCRRNIFPGSAGIFPYPYPPPRARIASSTSETSYHRDNRKYLRRTCPPSRQQCGCTPANGVRGWGAPGTLRLPRAKRWRIFAPSRCGRGPGSAGKMNHIQWLCLRPWRSSRQTVSYTACCASTKALKIIRIVHFSQPEAVERLNYRYRGRYLLSSMCTHLRWDRA